MISVLVNAVTKPFYKEHTGFFFVFLFFAGGFMRSNEHIAIAQYISKSNALTLILLLLFLLYHIKMQLFIKGHLQKEANRFLRDLALIPPSRQFRTLLIPQLAMNALVVVYAVFVVVFMWQAGAFIRLSMVVVYLSVSTIISVWLMMRQLKVTIHEPRHNPLTNFINRRFHKPYSLWHIIYLFKNRPILYLLSKALSIVILLGCFALYSPELYDWRFLGVGIVLAMSANLIIAHKHYEFQIIELSYFKSFPISRISRLAGYLITTFILMLPEAIIIIRKLPSDVGLHHYIQSILYGVVTTSFYFHWALLNNTNPEQLGKACFYFTILQIYIVLFGLPLYSICMAMAVLVLFVQLRYYRLSS